MPPANSTRNLLVLQPAASSLDLSALLGERGWRATRYADPKSLLVAARGADNAVGIAIIESRSAFNPCDLARLVAADREEWIAVISREVASDPDFGRVIANGFCDFHTLPLDLQRLEIVMGHAIGRRQLRERFARPEADDLGSYGMVGRSPAMRALYRAVEKVVRVDAPVLLVGEPGTGKKLLARSLHDHSERRQGPFVSVHCGTLSHGQAEAELFGLERNGSPGAGRYKAGSIECANGGSLFLQDIGSLPTEAQARLLRFLHERTIVPVGGIQSLRVDARVIAGTTKDLSRAVDRTHFIADLYYRLNRFQLVLPPLRDRRGDALLLADQLFEANASQRAPNVRDFSNEAREAIEKHDWPGNVPELISRVTKAMITCSGRLITPADLGLAGRETDSTKASLEEARLSADRDLIVAALERNGHNMAQTARQLGISRVTLYRLVNKLRITRAKVKRSRGGVRGRGPWIFSKKADPLRLQLPREAPSVKGPNRGSLRNSEPRLGHEPPEVTPLGEGEDGRKRRLLDTQSVRVAAHPKQTAAEPLAQPARGNLKAG